MTLRRPPLLMVHGLIGSLRDLVPLFSQRGVQAFAPDLLGYGEFQTVEVNRIRLEAQVDHLKGWIDTQGFDRVHLLGHSVGGAVAMLLAHDHPDRIASIINVEGNFSLKDAFWSADVARKRPDEVDAMLEGFRRDPAGWLARSGIPAEPIYLEAAKRLLGNQPASTLQATARSVVDVTGGQDFEAKVRAVFQGGAPVHLVAGERSYAGWSLPDQLRKQAASETILPGGHLMMVEAPEAFVAAVAAVSA